MATLDFPRHWLLIVSTVIYIFLSTWKFGNAYNYPHLGAASVLTNEYVPKAEAEGDGEHYYPQTGLVFDKALECLDDRNIYISCEEAYRLTQKGELNVPPEYAEQYCNGPCERETQLVLDCIDGILKYFVFYNKATLRDVRETVEDGCSYGPKRGDNIYAF
ncbi:hypothetical protein PHJA_000670800 [Phtheirospermum japonicum]|uniref:DUF7731 domain-containing protein n=1 Tax=Phtheirospermum japonicum TaxID=374723 RepID=A0A830BT54_9LAMI|nr:hypothetical protein PHJA_000670800 [Phtheirospermum japonicum]